VTARTGWNSLSVVTLVMLLSGCGVTVDEGPPGGSGQDEVVRLGPNGEWVSFVDPAHGTVVPNPVTFEIAAGGVDKVAIDAEGWHLGDAWDPALGDTFTYAFNGVGVPRIMTLTGFDAQDRVVAKHKIVITVEDAYVRIDAPADGGVVHNPVTFHISTSGVAMVALAADGWSMHEWSPEITTEITYEFNYTGEPRDVVLTGFDEYGHVLATDEITISFDAPNDDGSGGDDGGTPGGGGGGNPLAVPYFYQYDNAYEPSATCGLTSAAMLLNYFDPGSETPDHLYTAYGKGQGQSPGSLEQLYVWEGLYADSSYGGTRSMIKAQVDAGRPVLVHTFLTGAGHIVVITGYDGSGWFVNDPAGDWYQCYGCGVMGEQVHYPFGGGADDALSYDGDIWMSSAGTHSFSF
jgi:hypothetical protein